MKVLKSVFGNSGMKALIAYVTVGYPDVATTLRLVPLLAENGCDIVELGVPFSDPLADGVTIQRASYVALQQNVTPGTCLDVAAQLSRVTDVPLVFMSYYNPILRMGLQRFCEASQVSGVSGLIVPDLPPDEGEALEVECSMHGIDLVYLVSPGTPAARLAYVAARARGFLYMVSLTGVTGVRAEIDGGLEQFVARTRSVCSLPLCVGFGISSPLHAKQVARFADGVIVGSRLLQLVEEDRSLAKAVQFVRELRQSIDSPPG